MSVLTSHWSCSVKELKTIASSFGEDVSSVANVILDDPRFGDWSGSSKPYQHHYGRHGLSRHTLEVVVSAMSTANMYPFYHCDMKELFFACLFHDTGKMHDYAPTDSSMLHWGSTAHKRLIHHISRSAIIWNGAISLKYDLNEKYHENVLHAILAHHGLRQNGSPVAPKTRVAWILHFCDGLSARMHDSDTLDVVKHYS